MRRRLDGALAKRSSGVVRVRVVRHERDERHLAERVRHDLGRNDRLALTLERVPVLAVAVLLEHPDDRVRREPLAPPALRLVDERVDDQAIVVELDLPHSQRMDELQVWPHAGRLLVRSRRVRGRVVSRERHLSEHPALREPLRLRPRQPVGSVSASPVHVADDVRAEQCGNGRAVHGLPRERVYIRPDDPARDRVVDTSVAPTLPRILTLVVPAALYARLARQPRQV